MAATYFEEQLDIVDAQENDHTLGRRNFRLGSNLL